MVISRILRRSQYIQKKTQQHNEKTLQQVRVTTLTPITEQAILLELRPAQAGNSLTAFSPGAHIDVHISDRIVRQYSLIDLGVSHSPTYFVCVKKEPQGRGGSKHIHEEFAVGDVIEVSQPRNAFPVLAKPGIALLFSGGIGITPLISLAAHFHKTDIPFEFHCYARSQATMPLFEHVRNSPYSNSVFFHFSDEGNSLRINAPQALREPDKSSSLYMCGPTGFMNSVREHAAQFGWDSESIFSEQFEGTTTDITSEVSFTVVASSTGQKMDVKPTESIADVLERHGYETYRSCGQGYCGSCITSVVSGLPDHRDTFQSAQEHASNAYVNVCCSRSKTPILELDV